MEHLRYSDLRKKKKINKNTISKIVGEPFHGRCELDSHADTTASVKNCAIVKFMDRSGDVAPYSEKYTPMKDIPIVSAATGFASANGRNYLLVFHEALYMPIMRHTLINPNQYQHFRAKVQDNHYHEKCPMSIESFPHACSPLEPLYSYILCFLGRATSSHIHTLS